MYKKQFELFWQVQPHASLDFKVRKIENPENLKEGERFDLF